MKNIVYIEDQQLMVSIKDIAQYSDYKLENALALLKKHSSRFSFDFPEGSYKVQSTLCLSERVATHLIIYMENTEKVMNFKDELVEQFFRMKDLLCEVNKNQLATAQNNLKLALSSKMKTYKDGFMSLRKYIRENDINLKEDKAWDILYRSGCLEFQTIEYQRLILIDETMGRQENGGVIEFNSRALDTIFKDYIIVEPSLFD